MNKLLDSGESSKLSAVLVAASLIISCLAISLPFLISQNQIVYVDSQKLVNGYKGMLDARKEFESKAAVWKANVDTLRLELESKIKEYDLTKNKLTAKEKALMEELIQSRHEQFLSYQQAISEKIQKEDQDLTNKVLSTVNGYMKVYGQQKGYKIIMAATQYGNIVYAEERTDITDDVLRGLNLEYSK
jgi:outer membrane protein